MALARTASSSGSSSRSANSRLGFGVSNTIASWSGSAGSRRMPLFSESWSEKEPAIGPAASASDACSGRALSFLIGSIAGGALADVGQRGRFEDTRFEPSVLVVSGLLRPDRMAGRDQHKFVGRWELHHLARGQQRSRGLLS